MPWYDYLMCFLGGTFVANFFPHFVRGITGTPFPTPFANPPGRGLSPPALNILWALLNLVAGFVLLQFGEFSVAIWPLLVTGFAGFALMSLLLSRVFDTRPEDKPLPKEKAATANTPPIAEKPPAVAKPAVADKPPARDLRSGS